ncbi:MAG TPA: SBBP repeat-containing protein [Catalimonadaceae bacterium]|nr:SBBP repeat-containing protein [Catalimonadaceae bacterium]
MKQIFCVFLSLILSYPAFSQNFQWAGSIGGLYGEESTSIATDSSGNVFTTGVFDGIGDFDPGPGEHLIEAQSVDDLFIQKLDSNGNLVWVITLGNFNGGGYGSVLPQSIALDKSGNIYTAGYYLGPVDFDPGPGTSVLPCLGNWDAFVIKLNPDGAFEWVKSINGSRYERVNSIAIDEVGYPCITGCFNGTVDLDVGPGVSNSVSAGLFDIFIVKLDPDGNSIWTKQIGGPADDKGFHISTEPKGDIYVSGCFGKTVDFNPNGSGGILNAVDSISHCILKLHSDGRFDWVKKLQIHHHNTDYRCPVVADNKNNLYVTGFFYGSVVFDSGVDTVTITSKGDADVFILKIDSSGQAIWARSVGGSDGDFSASITLDEEGNIYTTGNFTNTVDFDPGPDVFNLTNAGKADMYCLGLKPNGDLLWARGIGGTWYDGGSAIALDQRGNVYITGHFEKTVDFDPGPRSYLMSTGFSNSSIFVMKLGDKIKTLPDHTQPDTTGNPPYFLPFPNPVSSYFYIRSDHEHLGTDYTLYDVPGRKLLSGKLLSAYTKVDVETLPPAVYFLDFDTHRQGEDILTRKVVKVR